MPCPRSSIHLLHLPQQSSSVYSHKAHLPKTFTSWSPPQETIPKMSAQPENMLSIHGSSHVCLQGPTLSKCAIGGCRCRLWLSYEIKVLLMTQNIMLNKFCYFDSTFTHRHSRTTEYIWAHGLAQNSFLRSGSSARRVDSVDKVDKPKQHSIHFRSSIQPRDDQWKQFDLLHSALPSPLNGRSVDLATNLFLNRANWMARYTNANMWHVVLLLTLANHPLPNETKNWPTHSCRVWLQFGLDSLHILKLC